MINIGWLLISIILFSTPLLLAAFVLFNLICDFLAAPFVPTEYRDMFEILKKAKLKKGQKFLELGSGDGRMVRMAVKRYGVLGLGIELNPFLVWYSKVVSFFSGSRNIRFKLGNFYNEPVSDMDAIFIFLTPRAQQKLADKFRKEAKKGALIISHGFKLPGFESKLIDKIDRKVFPTYYYKM